MASQLKADPEVVSTGCAIPGERGDGWSGPFRARVPGPPWPTLAVGDDLPDRPRSFLTQPCFCYVAEDITGQEGRAGDGRSDAAAHEARWTTPRWGWSSGTPISSSPAGPGRPRALSGWTAAEVVGRRIDSPPAGLRGGRAEGRGGDDPAARPGQPVRRLEEPEQHEGGRVVSCEWYNSVLHDEAGGWSPSCR